MVNCRADGLPEMGEKNIRGTELSRGNRHWEKEWKPSTLGEG